MVGRHQSHVKSIQSYYHILAKRTDTHSVKSGTIKSQARFSHSKQKRKKSQARCYMSTCPDCLHTKTRHFNSSHLTPPSRVYGPLSFPSNFSFFFDLLFVQVILHKHTTLERRKQRRDHRFADKLSGENKGATDLQNG